ncbi:glutamate-5-semialdehyde dehydrogenase [Albibacterium bauzanense]|uniref:Gamma-glutamyl phosphate reductase n=1 Tax=Albibacterium bauzanense TaxID=653929 RepID=A0A4R1M1Q8_9SPHI|nr:glutamate-5-semialdehyde dehydrogenase [Albibacterium bauzanense]TCK85132.1 glutamate-5-semialdehyde dehydrogenase [Albibacterium bauzanense]
MENIQEILKSAAKATTVVQALSEEVKKSLLKELSTRLKNSKKEILASNQLDLNKMDDADPKKDRLVLTDARIDDLSSSLDEIAALPDPANQVIVERTLDNGLQVIKKTVPLGVVGVIYESRPNVTIDVAALCLRSGNVCLLRGGSDAFHTNTILVELIHQCLDKFNINRAVVQLLPVDRRFVDELLNASKYVDIIIPRGSDQLIQFVRNNSKVPVIETGAGVCHTYVETTADLEKAVSIVVNAKVTRPSVCNALDTVIVDRAIAKPFLELLAPKLADFQVEIFADKESYDILSHSNYKQLQAATQEDFGREFLDMKCSVLVLENIDEALDHISNYSSKHSEAIVSKDADKQVRFLNEVDAAAVYVNASTRFTDGGVFGLGAEIGISTQKLHARGPFALEKLVTEKWLIRGDGQIR